MSVTLWGPQPLDPQAVDRSARALLEAYLARKTGELVAHPLTEGDGSAPGLYLIARDDKVAGFWVTVDQRFLDDGPASSHRAPFAHELLEALTEAIWWSAFPVTPVRAGRWTPLLVTEWLPELADRCDVPPPGMYVDPSADDAGEQAIEDGGQWLEPVVKAMVPTGPPRVPTAKLEWMGLPDERSLLTVVRGDLRRLSTRHEGSYQLVAVPEPTQVARMGRPLEEWLQAAVDAPDALPDAVELGHPVRLSTERAGFPITGWLTRELAVRPVVPATQPVTALAPRDVRSQLLAQLMLSAGITALVFVGVFALLQAVHTASSPRPRIALGPREAEAQPAMSVCSAEHQGFVEEFRCQVRRLSQLEGRELRPHELQLELARPCGAPWADDGDEHLDLFATYCGLRDRAGDQWLEGDYEWAKVAAAQACHNVLQKPYTHKRGDNYAVADPHKYFVSESERVSALVHLVDGLDSACEDFRVRMRRRIGGAVLATHVGADDASEAAALRELLFQNAEVGFSETDVQCFEEGGRFGVSRTQWLQGVCGVETSQRDPANWPVSWSPRVRQEVADVLHGEPWPDAPEAVERYAKARFAGRPPPDDLWQCHASLAEGKAWVDIEAKWHQQVITPRSYTQRPLRSQFTTDAVLTTLREGGAADAACWRVVDGLVGGYEPVHPLLAAVEPGSWPSEDQQVCAQACAVAYRLAESPAEERWRTRWTDVAMCTSEAPLSRRDPEALEQLDLPWNQDSTGAWVAPSTAEVCAFHLIAQGYLPGVVIGPDPALWAGEETKGVAGGPGDAFNAARALSSYGRNRSSTACGSAAVQCLGGLLLDVTSRRTASHLQARRSEDPVTHGPPAFEPHQWAAAWREQIAEIPAWEKSTLEEHPWCRLVRPYLNEDLSLPEGELDYPCALGVRDAIDRYELAITQVATDAGQEGG